MKNYKFIFEDFLATEIYGFGKKCTIQRDADMDRGKPSKFGYSFPKI